MKTNLILILLFLFYSYQASCQINHEDEFLKFPLKTIYAYCQDKLDTPCSLVYLTYDNENRLIQYSLFRDNAEFSRIVYNYNALGLLESKVFYAYYSNNVPPRTRVYQYDEKNRLIYEGFDGDNGNNSKNYYSYGKYGELISSKNECNDNELNYYYEYNSIGRLSEKYKNKELEVSYEYLQYKLSKETHYYTNRKKEIQYVYDDNEQLITKLENGEIIEKNIYEKSRLVERWTYYFGIDPCYSPCCGQYFTKYEYY